MTLVLTHVVHITQHVTQGLCCIVGQSWTDFNAAQVRSRNNMLAMYGAKRKLLQRNLLSNIVRHVYLELFIVQVSTFVTNLSPLDCKLQQWLLAPDLAV